MLRDIKKRLRRIENKLDRSLSDRSYDQPTSERSFISNKGSTAKIRKGQGAVTFGKDIQIA